MNPLNLSIKLERTKLITGESLPVALTLENRGEAVIEVPDPRIGSAFSYTVESAPDQEVTYYLSAARAYAERHLEPKRSRGLPGLALAPGASVVYRDDVARYMVQPVGPGSYTLMASYQGPFGVAESVPLDFAIVAPQPVRAVTCIDTNQARLAAVFAQPADLESVTLYQVEHPASRPGDGPAHARKQGIPTANLGGLALAVEVADTDGGRWIGWIEGDSICAGLGDEHYVSRLVSPVAHGLRNASLAPVGFQMGDRALLLALGDDADGRVLLVAATFSLSAPAAVKRIPIVGHSIPTQWVARYRDIAVDTIVDLIVATQTDATTSIVRQTISLGSETAGSPDTLHTCEGRIVAMAMEPVGRGTASEGAVDILLGPAPANGRLSLVRVAVSGGAVGSPWNLSNPERGGGGPSTTWALPRIPTEPPMVVAHAGEKLYLRRRGSRWHTVIEGVPKILHLGVEVLPDGRQVLVWADPLFGLRWRFLY